MTPSWIKIVYSLFAAVTVAADAVNNPLENFLWFFDIAQVLTVSAL